RRQADARPFLVCVPIQDRNAVVVAVRHVNRVRAHHNGVGMTPAVGNDSTFAFPITPALAFTLVPLVVLAIVWSLALADQWPRLHDLQRLRTLRVADVKNVDR